jgi:2,4-dichlorophenol 6-monooxygenase
VCRGASRVSTLDLGGHGHFTMFTGLGGSPWVAAAAAVSAALEVAVDAVTIGPGADWEDVYGDWAGVREIRDTGCIVARPDNYVCFRSPGAVEDATATLSAVLRQVLAL